MRAAAIQRHGGLDEIQMMELPRPEARPGEVVIQVKSIGLNHLDIWMRKGRPGLNFRFPHPLGSDASGIVSEVGAGVEQVRVGDEVIINPGLSCMQCEWCLRGAHSECPGFGIVGMVRHGTYAEYVAVPAVNVYPKPAHLNWDEAAALPLAHLTAWRMLFTRANARPGETALIHGIGGGVALALLQLAKASGLRVIVTSSDSAKLERARALGADECVNYREEGVAAKALAWTEGRGVDLCLDTVGAQTWPINFEAVRKAGRIVHCGVTTGPATEVNIAALYWKQLSVLGSTMGSHEDFRLLLSFAEATGLKPVMDSVHSLDEARAAQDRMERGEQFGKIALRV